MKCLSGVSSSIIFEKPSRPNRSSEAKRHLRGVIDSVILQRPSGPNWSDKGKGQSSEVNKLLGEIKEHNEVGVSNAVNYTNKL